MSNLNFVDITEISGVGRKWAGGRQKGDLVISVCHKNKNNKNKNKKEYYGMAFMISAKLVKEYRLINGDRVKILFDKKARTGLIQRVTNGGRAVTMRSNWYMARVQLTYRPEMGIYPSENGIVADTVTVDQHGIMFVLSETDCNPANLRKFE